MMHVSSKKFKITLLILFTLVSGVACAPALLNGSNLIKATSKTNSATNETVVIDGVAEGEHRIFVTSQTYNGNLGGQSGADYKCQVSAQSAGLKRNYIAVVSTSAANAYYRIADTGAIYIFPVEYQKVMVANSWSSLWSGSSLLNAINNTELYTRLTPLKNSFTLFAFLLPLIESINSSAQAIVPVAPAPAPAPVPVSTTWTGTLSTGLISAANGNCSDWTSSNALTNGESGVKTVTSTTWIQNGATACSSLLRLYCISQ